MPVSANLRRGGALLAASLAAVLAVVVPAQPAWAHARLVSTDPAAGAVVATPLSTISLTFSEMMKQQFSTIVVTGPDGRAYGDGAARSVDRTLSQTVKPLPGGVVTVAWRAVSADGHPLEGRFTFTSTAPAPSSAAPSSAAPAAPSSAAVPPPSAAAGPLDAEPKSADSGLGGTGALIGGAVLAVLAVAGVLLLLRRRRRPTGT